MDKNFEISIVTCTIIVKYLCDCRQGIPLDTNLAQALFLVYLNQMEGDNNSDYCVKIHKWKYQNITIGNKPREISLKYQNEFYTIYPYQLEASLK